MALRIEWSREKPIFNGKWKVVQVSQEDNGWWKLVYDKDALIVEGEETEECDV